MASSRLRMTEDERRDADNISADGISKMNDTKMLEKYEAYLRHEGFADVANHCRMQLNKLRGASGGMDHVRDQSGIDKQEIQEMLKALKEMDNSVRTATGSAPAAPIRKPGAAVKSKAPAIDVKDVVAQNRNLPEVERVQVATSHRIKGNDCFKENAWADSISYYTIAIELYPEVKAYNNRAIARMKLKQHTLALEDCSKALEYEPRNVKALLRRATCFKEMSRYKEAGQDAQLAIDAGATGESLSQLVQIKKLAEEKQGYHRVAIEEVSDDDGDNDDATGDQNPAATMAPAPTPNTSKPAATGTHSTPSTTEPANSDCGNGRMHKITVVECSESDSDDDFHPASSRPVTSSPETPSSAAVDSDGASSASPIKAPTPPTSGTTLVTATVATAPLPTAAHDSAEEETFQSASSNGDGDVSSSNSSSSSSSSSSSDSSEDEGEVPVAVTPGLSDLDLGNITIPEPEPDCTREAAEQELLDLANAAKNEGNARFNGQDSAGALECYKLALQSLPDNAVLHSNCAIVKMKLEPPQCWEAIKDASISVELNNQHFKGLFLRAQAKLKVEYFDGAIEDVRAAMNMPNVTPEEVKKARNLFGQIKEAKDKKKKQRDQEQQRTKPARTVAQSVIIEEIGEEEDFDAKRIQERAQQLEAEARGVARKLRQAAADAIDAKLQEMQAARSARKAQAEELVRLQQQQVQARLAKLQQRKQRAQDKERKKAEKAERKLTKQAEKAERKSAKHKVQQPDSGSKVAAAAIAAAAAASSALASATAQLPAASRNSTGSASANVAAALKSPAAPAMTPPSEGSNRTRANSDVKAAVAAATARLPAVDPVDKVAQADVLNADGKRAYAAEDYALAKKCFKAAAELSPTDSRMFSNLGRACLNLGEHKQALAALEEAIRLLKGPAKVDNKDIMLVKAMVHKASALLGLKQPGEALSMLNQAKASGRGVELDGIEDKVAEADAMIKQQHQDAASNATASTSAAPRAPISRTSTYAAPTPAPSSSTPPTPTSNGSPSTTAPTSGPANPPSSAAAACTITSPAPSTNSTPTTSTLPAATSETSRSDVEQRELKEALDAGLSIDEFNRALNYFLKGSEAVAQQEWRRAKVAYNASLAINKNHARSMGNLTLVHLKLEQYTEVVKYGKQALAAGFSDKSKVHYRMACALEKLGHLQPALWDIELAYKANHHNPTIRDKHKELTAKVAATQPAQAPTPTPTPNTPLTTHPSTPKPHAADTPVTATPQPVPTPPAPKHHPAPSSSISTTAPTPLLSPKPSGHPTANGTPTPAASISPRPTPLPTPQSTPSTAEPGSCGTFHRLHIKEVYSDSDDDDTLIPSAPSQPTPTANGHSVTPTLAPTVLPRPSSTS